ncbi:MAG: hypothetical protein Q9180_004900, partial [Flavoplaca navasiana]
MASTVIDGIRIEILQGQTNYNRWYRDFKSLATVKGVWEICKGTEAIMAAPERPQKPQVVREARGASELDKELARNAFKELLDEYTLGIQEYKVLLTDYDTNYKKVQTARGIIAATIDPTIRTVIQDKDPKKALKE